MLEGANKETAEKAKAVLEEAGATVTDESVLSAVLRRLVGVGDGYTRLRPVTIPDVARQLADPDSTLSRVLYALMEI